MTVHDRKAASGEQRLLNVLKPYLATGASGSYAVTGGDDASVRRGKRGERLVLTTDALVEGTHFCLEHMRMDEVGRKALAVNLSDCAAMGARPDGALVELIIPQRCADPTADVRRLYRGMSAIGRREGCPTVGGNIARGPCWVVSVTLVGRLIPGCRPLLRNGLRPGDDLWVSGSPGSAAAGLDAVLHWGRDGVPDEFRQLVAAHVRPRPRIAAGQALARCRGVSAAMDLSDGLCLDCTRLARASGVRIVLDSRRLPLSAAMRSLARMLGRDAADWVLGGGEDYELVWGAGRGTDMRRVMRGTGVRCRRIGTVERGHPGLAMTDGDTVSDMPAAGWDHLG